MKFIFLTYFLVFIASICFCHSFNAPFSMRLSCGAQHNVYTQPNNAFWLKDFSYTGGVIANGTRASFITPPLPTVRYFPLSAGPENCYNIKGVPVGRYQIRIFLGLIEDPNFGNEPLFDISVEGTLLYSLKSGWSNHDDEQSFVEAIVFLKDGSSSICFHSTGHGDPTVLSIEIMQMHDKAYNFHGDFGRNTVLRTVKRISCADRSSKFDVDYGANAWGGDRFWNLMTTFYPVSDHGISTRRNIGKASTIPNFYPEGLYRTALVSTVSDFDLAYAFDVDTSKNYSVWFHFSEIDTAISGEGQRVFDILVNDEVVFRNVDVVKMSGDIFTALVLNKTISVTGRTLTITMSPLYGSFPIISAIEVFEVIKAESKTLNNEVRALQKLKDSLLLPARLGWNGDPCVPQRHPWNGVACHFDSSSSSWVIDGIDLQSQGLTGIISNDISQLQHLQSINLRGNNIQGEIPDGLGNITSLETLDLSFNYLNGSIPGSFAQMKVIRKLNLNGNALSGRVPTDLGGRLLHRASFNFTDNAGLCGMPGLPGCGGDLSNGAKMAIGWAVPLGFILIVAFSIIWWKRQQNILRVQKLAAARNAPYAKARTHFSHNVHMTRHHAHGQEQARGDEGVGGNEPTQPNSTLGSLISSQNDA